MTPEEFDKILIGEKSGLEEKITQERGIELIAVLYENLLKPYVDILEKFQKYSVSIIDRGTTGNF